MANTICVSVCTEVDVDVDIDLDDYKDQIAEALGEQGLAPWDEMRREYKLFGSNALKQYIKDQMYNRFGISIEL